MKGLYFVTLVSLVRYRGVDSRDSSVGVIDSRREVR